MTASECRWSDSLTCSLPCAPRYKVPQANSHVPGHLRRLVPPHPLGRGDQRTAGARVRADVHGSLCVGGHGRDCSVSMGGCGRCVNIFGAMCAVSAFFLCILVCALLGAYCEVSVYSVLARVWCLRYWFRESQMCR